jgi:hypothetical protein
MRLDFQLPINERDVAKDQETETGRFRIIAYFYFRPPSLKRLLPRWEASADKFARQIRATNPRDKSARQPRTTFGVRVVRLFRG